MTDFEVHPGGTAKRLAELEALLAPLPAPMCREDLRVGDRVRVVTDWTGVVTDTSCAAICVCDDEDGSVLVVRDDGATNTYLLDRPDPELELVDDKELVKVVVDWVRNLRYISTSEEDDARDLIRRLYAKAVQL